MDELTLLRRIQRRAPLLRPAALILGMAGLFVCLMFVLLNDRLKGGASSLLRAAGLGRFQAKLQASVDALHRYRQHYRALGQALLLSALLQVEIIVTDSGSGISKENLGKIFDPFFTTKPPGKGTGLGLSICHRIIDKLGGHISVTSEPGHGTTFTIRLPQKGEV